MAKTFLVNAGSLSASRVFLALSQVLVLPVVARFLDPVEFGDMALAMSVVVFAQILSDAGLGRSLIRQPQYNPAEWNSVFWLLTCVGLVLTLTILALAPVWANLFDRPRLLWLLAALSALPLLNALAAVSMARIEKDRQFQKLALVRTVAGVAGLVTVLVLAASGAGVWALVAQQLVIAAVQTFGGMLVSRFRPGPPRGFTPLGRHIRFATDNIGGSFLFTAQRQVPIMLISSALGAAALGLYSMADRFLNLSRTTVAGPIAQVVYVRMVNAQKDLRNVAEIYVASCRTTAVVVFPPMAILAGSGQSLFPWLLSEKWAPAAMVFALAAPGIMIEVATASGGVMFQALDRTRLRLRMIAERAILRTATVAIALPFGLDAVALAITLFSVAFMPRYLAYTQRVAPISQRSVAAALVVPALVSGVAWVALATAAPRYGEVQVLGLALAALALTWGAIALLQSRQLRSAMHLLSG